jgi:catechol 2,3-dioxygenase-like lactoylglutathione lyase family enzyme
MTVPAASLLSRFMSEGPRARPLPAEAPLVEAVDRIVIAVRDLAGAERIYTRMLGRTPSWVWMDKGGGTSRVVYRLDNASIELVAPISAGPWGTVVSRRLDLGGEGIFALILSTKDAARTAEGLTARGLPSITFPDTEATGPAGENRRWRNVHIPPPIAADLIVLCNEQLSPAAAIPKAPLRGGVAESEAVSAVDHVVVMTPDAEAVKRLFGNHLGIRLALDHSKPEWGVRQLFFRLGGVTLEVVEPLDKARAPKGTFFWGLAWRVGSVATVRERLLREGADVSELRVGRKKGTEVASIRKPTNDVPVLLVGPLPGAD